MHKRLPLALLLLLTAAGLNAQESKPQPSAGQSAGKTSGLVTLEGCLQSSNGHFDLTGKRWHGASPYRRRQQAQSPCEP